LEIGRHSLVLPMKPKKAFLSIKYHKDNGNRAIIESICEALSAVGFNTSVVVRDIEDWGEINLSSQELMKRSFNLIDKCQVVFVECSQKGMGVGIEAGYAFARGKPIVVLAKKGTELSNTLSGIANEVFYYSHPSELSVLIESLLFL